MCDSILVSDKYKLKTVQQTCFHEGIVTLQLQVGHQRSKSDECVDTKKPLPQISGHCYPETLKKGLKWIIKSYMP